MSSSDEPLVGNDDRRQHERVPARVEVHFNDPADAARAFRAYSLNLSAGGLCFRSNRRYERGATLELALQIAGELHKLKAVVAWTRGDAVGIRFVEVPADTQQSLHDIIQTLKSQLPGS